MMKSEKKKGMGEKNEPLDPFFDRSISLQSDLDACINLHPMHFLELQQGLFGHICEFGAYKQLE